MLMEECWDQDPSVRPHVADALAHFEAASRDWVSPTPEAIANLGHGPTSRTPPMTELTDTISGGGFRTTGGDAVDSREGGKLLQRSCGEEENDVI